MEHSQTPTPDILTIDESVRFTPEPLENFERSPDSSMPQAFPTSPDHLIKQAGTGE